MMLSTCGAGELLRVPWKARRSNQSILMEINPEYSLEGLMLKLKFQCFDHLMQTADSLEKTLMLGAIGGRRRSLFCCCCCSVTQLCLTLCDPIDCSRPGLPVPHHLPKFTQVHAHCIGDAMQPTHPLTLSSPSALNLSQHQGIFQ